MHILLISTIRHNPGDGFIRLGQEWLFRQLIPDARFSIAHKHDPRTLFGDFERRTSSPHRLVAPLLYRLHAARTRGPDLLAEADLVVFAGTPFIWRQNARLLPSTSANAEWVGATWGRLFHELPRKPVANLAAGTSLNPGQAPAAILGDARLTAFLRAATERAALTTARDQLTSQVLSRLGHRVPVLPCTSLWAAAGAGLSAAPPGYIAVNVMRHAVHAARGKETDPQAWRRTITAVVQALSDRHRILFICHSREERLLVDEWFPGHEAVFSLDETELLDAYSRASYTVSNRVHGAAGAASFGRPALCIGGDSRMALLAEFGLPSIIAGEATPDRILAVCADFETNHGQWSKRMGTVQRTAEDGYLALLRELVPA